MPRGAVQFGIVLLLLIIGISPFLGAARGGSWGESVSPELLERIDRYDADEYLVLVQLAEAEGSSTDPGQSDYHYISRIEWARLAGIETVSSLLASVGISTPLRIQWTASDAWEVPLSYIHCLSSLLLWASVADIQEMAQMPWVAHIRSAEDTVPLLTFTHGSAGSTGMLDSEGIRLSELTANQVQVGTDLERMASQYGWFQVDRSSMKQLADLGLESSPLRESFVGADYESYSLAAYVIRDEALVELIEEPIDEAGTLDGVLSACQDTITLGEVYALLDTAYSCGADMLTLASLSSEGRSEPIFLLWRSEHVEALASLGAVMVEGIQTTPDSPPHLITTRGSHEDRVAVEWEAVAGVDVYEILRSSEVGGALQTIAVVDGTTFSDSDICVCESLEYRVRSITPSGAGQLSLPSTGNIGVVPEPVPEARANGYDLLGAIELSWTAVDNATYYRVLRTQYMTDGSRVPAQQYNVANVADTRFIDQDVIVGQKYLYRIRAVNGCGGAELSHQVTGMAMFAPLAGKTLNPPVWVDTTRGQPYDVVNVAWSKVDGAEGYQIYRSLSYDGPFEELAYTVDTGWSDLEVELCGDYWYRIQAVGESEVSALSTTSYGSYGYRPAAPQNVLASLYTYPESIRVTWNAMPDTITYHVIRAPSEDGPFGPLGHTSELYYLDEGLVPGQEFWYLVRASNPCGCSGNVGVARGATTSE
ncbi:fibronectin type III domain-containing protein [Candidatus Bipolaricaulota bacterium]